MRVRNGWLVLALMAMPAWAAAAEVCRQVDERGRTQFVDCRHAGKGAEQVDATLPETGASMSTEAQKERFRAGLPQEPAAAGKSSGNESKKSGRPAREPLPTFRGDAEYRSWIAAQEEACAADMAAALKKMRDARIQLCIQEQERSEPECRRYYADFGLRGRGDGTSKRLYDQPDSCRRLDEVRRQRSRAGG